MSKKFNVNVTVIMILKNLIFLKRIGEESYRQKHIEYDICVLQYHILKLKHDKHQEI